MLDEKFKPLVQNVFFLFDSVTGKITRFIKVFTDKHKGITEYVEKTYSKV